MSSIETGYISLESTSLSPRIYHAGILADIDFGPSEGMRGGIVHGGELVDRNADLRDGTEADAAQGPAANDTEPLKSVLPVRDDDPAVRSAGLR